MEEIDILGKITEKKNQRHKENTFFYDGIDSGECTEIIEPGIFRNPYDLRNTNQGDTCCKRCEKKLAHYGTFIHRAYVCDYNYIWCESCFEDMGFYIVITTEGV